MKRDPKIGRATRKGHVPNSKPEGKQPAGNAFIEGGAGPKGMKNRPGLFRAAKAESTKKVPIPAGKVVKKDRKGVAKGPRVAGRK
jgi:hypothetical protein